MFALIMESTPATAAQVTGVLEVLGSVFTYLIGKIGDVVNVVMENPLLLIPIGITLGYVVIKFFKRLFHN